MCIRDSFKYLGHFITNDMYDDKDIQRELQNMFIRTKVLIRRFHKCSLSVKIVLFKTYCLCMYDVALWSKFFLSLDLWINCNLVTINVLNYSLALDVVTV